VRQSQRGALYQSALDRLLAAGQAYPCGCTRKEIDDVLETRHGARPRHAERIYPGTCRTGLHGKPARAVRVRTDADGADRHIEWIDRRLGRQRQNLTREVGDFVLKRADGLWAYQLAVVVDDAEQGVTHVVRGEDLADNTPRQIHLQRLLGLPTPAYLHTPLVLGPDGEKLSKQHGAAAIDASNPLPALRAAGVVLDIHSTADGPIAWLADACAQWRRRWLA
jgi:glutamyl-Q tRNA(Asp) synthetase